MKKNIAIAIWFLGMVIVALMLFGCATNRPNFEPLPPEKLYDLLHEDELRSIAYKSPTIKEIIGEKDFN